MRSSKRARAFVSLAARIIVSASILLLAVSAAMAQATTGTLRGTVADTNGAGVSNATVTVKNAATSDVKTSTTTGEGVFEVSNLQPGSYTVTVEASNFKRSV